MPDDTTMPVGDEVLDTDGDTTTITEEDDESEDESNDGTPISTLPVGEKEEDDDLDEDE
jgi:hypothetical protein